MDNEKINEMRLALNNFIAEELDDESDEHSEANIVVALLMTAGSLLHLMNADGKLIADLSKAFSTIARSGT